LLSLGSLEIMKTNPLILSPEQLCYAIPSILNLGQLHFTSQCLHAVVKLRVPNVIGDGQLSVKEIAAALPGTPNQEALLRCMRLLATPAADIFEEAKGPGGECVFSLTPTGALLQTGVEQPSMACGVENWMEKPMWYAWSYFPDLVAGNLDKSPFEFANDKPIFDVYRESPESGEPYSEFMSFLSTMELPVIATSDYIDWDAMEDKTVVDVGGSLGFVMGAVAEAYPDVTCVSFDLPEVTSVAEGGSPPEEVTFVAGDMFDSSTIPKGDVMLLKHILRDWNDDDAVRILKSCQAAMPEEGKVIIVDGMLPEPGQATDNDIAQFNLDVLMMTYGGKERTRSEMENLAKLSGLKVEQVTETPLPSCQILVLTKA